jgi:hypothetical protein
VVHTSGPHSALQRHFDFAKRLIQEALLRALVDEFDPPRLHHSYKASRSRLAFSLLETPQSLRGSGAFCVRQRPRPGRPKTPLPGPACLSSALSSRKSSENRSPLAHAVPVFDHHVTRVSRRAVRCGVWSGGGECGKPGAARVRRGVVANGHSSVPEIRIARIKLPTVLGGNSPASTVRSETPNRRCGKICQMTVSGKRSPWWPSASTLNSNR